MEAAIRAAEAASLPEDGRVRVVISGFTPEIDGGAWPVKRVVSEPVAIEADVFADGHDVVAAVLLHRPPGGAGWIESPLTELGNDRWRGRIVPEVEGVHEVTILGWIDTFATWQRDLRKRVDAGQDVAVELLVGEGLLKDRASRTAGPELHEAASVLRRGGAEAVELGLSTALAALAAAHDPRRDACRLEPARRIDVDRARARDGAWYELFPRSHAAVPGRHGTLRDVERLLPRLAGMGFDVVYLPPIHPIGRVNRKGRNNSTVAQPGDVGSPWAIGSSEGGHEAVHPDLGTPGDVRRLTVAARELGMDVALDLALQCAPDHPWVARHPQWFKQRPDGSIRHAENPPKKYEDIHPLDFECEDWRALWQACLGIVLHWMDHGVRAFRVDNPHGKPLRFWQWLIRSARERDPGVIFLSEAFTRPRVMEHLAKAGFSQSYTYFTWRTRKQEIEEYLRYLASPPVSEFFRPAFWPNTPDILHESLQAGGRPAFAARLVFAATAASTYGVYGPAYEACERVPVREGSEEYLDSEKYQLRTWRLDAEGSLAPLMARLNSIRRAERAFRGSAVLSVVPSSDEAMVAYARRAEGSAPVLVVLSLDPASTREGLVDVDPVLLGLPPGAPFRVTDLLDGSAWEWRPGRNFVSLRPDRDPAPAHVFRIDAPASAAPATEVT